VDDPYAFGAIAATNALSDVYAMGARPLLALNLVAWPRDPELLELLGETLRGGSDVVREAGAFLLGGHSIDDKEPKYGMVAVGEVHPEQVIDNAGARPGDMLVLTKPLGTGILSTAVKREMLSESDIAGAIASMATLNAGAAQAMRTVGEAVHAATDVTGFGLLGHLRNMLEASHASARVSISSLPVFDEVRTMIERDAVPGGTARNLDAIGECTRFADGVARSDRLLAADAQTSGGLLIAVAASHVDQLIAALKQNRTPAAAVIGEIAESGDRLMEVVP
jgi:selenide,water dikinase